MPEKHYLTKDKLEELKNELNELKTKRRVDVAERLQRAKELGDLSENVEYFEAREEQALVEGRILQLEEMIKNAQIIEKAPSSSTVKIGSTVMVKKGDEKMRFVIVGSNEVKPEEGLISNESPLGSAFLDKKVGDVVEVNTPKGKIVYKIISIS